jgi:arylsulfatase A-like enzyme
MRSRFRLIAAVVVAAIACVALLATIVALREGDDLPPPNVVLVIGCTVRRDQVSPYGGHPATTPFLTELANHGARFRDAISAAPWTRAAATAILTGRPFREVGMAEPGDHSSMRVLAPAVTTLAEAFRARGYVTIGGTANPNLNRVFGFEQGFQRYHQASLLWRFGMRKVPGFRVVRQLLPEIDRRPPGAPLYLQLTFLDAHQPGTVDPELLPQFGEGVPRRVLEYRALLNRFDRSVRELWDALAERGFDDTNTLFVVVSDHGEGIQWPRNQGVGHGRLLVPSTLEMTWLLRGRGVPHGVTIDGLASQVDVFPTIASLAGVAGYDGPGRDWSSLVQRGGTTTRERAYSDTDYQEMDRSAIFTDTTSCEIHQLEETREVRCWDRVADRYHERPLATVDARLVEELDTWRAAQLAAAEVWPWTSNAFPTRNELQMLEQLGYIE